MIEALMKLLASRKFLVMLGCQLAIAFPAVFGKMNPELAAELGAAVAAVWMAAHAHEEKGK